MMIRFRALSEPDPGPLWREHFERLFGAYRRWFLREGDGARPTYLECVRALREHMPRLLPTYEAVVDLAGGGDLAARLLSLYCPTPYLTGCSQAVWTRGQPMLIRNYDYAPRLWDATLWHSAWNGAPIIAMSDCFWGALDGVNAAGLSVSLAFGGRKIVGRGFGIPLVLRYVLEFCSTTAEATGVLRAVPSHMAYNITVLDAAGRHATVYVAPDRPAVVTPRAVATNHQRIVEWHQFAHATASVDREQFLQAHRAAAAETAERFVGRFMQPPLFSLAFNQGWGTLYTAVYRPDARAAEYRWANHVLEQSVEHFQPCALSIHYRDDAAPLGITNGRDG